MTDKMPEAKFPPWDGVDDTMKIDSIQFPSSGILRTAKVFGYDMVNSPPHYTKGKFEAIDVIEDAVQHAPNAVYGTLQWQTLKYLLRMWHKNSVLEDAKKARWYLDRLINKMEM